MIWLNNKRGQAVVEFGIFGSVLLVIFSILLSQLQRANDEQYVKMEAFRRAEEKACSYNGGQGASVQMTLIQNRRHVDMFGGFRKGSPQTLNASASVYWAVPPSENDAEAASLIAFRVNQDEKVISYRDYVPKAHDDGKGNDDWSFRTEDINSTSNTVFDESTSKTETPAGINNARLSSLRDSVNTVITYSVRQEDSDDNDKNDPKIQEGELWNLTQRVYRDTDGQYKYKAGLADNTQIQRAKQWDTGF